MKKKATGSVRIIGGAWRGSRVPVPGIPGLRPSGDRARETLFNWLQMHIRGAICIDLFAGSGVLGLEAASRGAASVILVEKSRQAVQEIRNSILRLGASQLEVIEADAIAWLAGCDSQSMDIVFVDPPFGSGLEILALDLLTQKNCVRKGGFLYLETARETPVKAPPPGWEIAKEKALGEVQMQLLKKI